MPSMTRIIGIGLIAFLVIMFLKRADVIPQSPKIMSFTYGEAVSLAKDGKIYEIAIDENNITGMLMSGASFTTVRPAGDGELIKILLEEGKGVKVAAPSWTTLIFGNPFFFLGISLIAWFFFLSWFNKKRSGGGFSPLRKQLYKDNQSIKVTFQDVAGVDEAKEELEEVVQFLKNPTQFTKLGGRMPKGALLVGPSGTGKTLLARAVAGEAGVSFFSMSGSGFVELYVGVGASRVRDLFANGKKHAPCIIFIDEIDAVGGARQTGLMGAANDERQQTLNQLLVEMDGFENETGIMVIAATNRPDVLDPALLRPGRFDRRVVVSKPTANGRMEILKIHTRKIPLSTDVDLMLVAKATPGFTGADLENLANEAALLAARLKKDSVETSDLLKARDKVMMGPARKEKGYVTEEERMSIAYHESGHAFVAIKMKEQGADPLHKISIISRGNALGMTQQLPEYDKKIMNDTHLKTELTILMGGRVAEKIKFKHLSTGASNDLEKATEFATKMICQWGMSEVVGPRVVARGHENQGWLSQKEHSSKLDEDIDQEIKRLVLEAEETATRILTDLHAEGVLDRGANLLLEKEEAEGAEFEALITP